jgi:Na+/H+ antiporter NhaD/arsenite permease-like protein
LLAGGIFLAIYALIVTERIHRTLAALLGAVVVIALGLVTQHEAFSPEVVDFNVIFLLAGMMIIANILGKTGLFQWLAVEAVRRAQGRPYRLLVLISLITAVASAFLDNVTTVVLMTPVTFFIAQRLGANPTPFLISEILASNIGGTATLIGDPPNIIIGSRLGKDFGDFLVNAGPVAVVALVAYLIFARWLFRKDLAGAGTALEPDDIARLVEAERRIEDPHLMRLGLAVLGATIVGFLLARPLGLEGATIALAGAVVKSGLISDLAKQALAVTGGRTDLAALLVLWMSAVLSAIVDNIPYTITMVPLVQELGQTLDVEPLIWALVIGADFGGNATIVGASANVVVSSMSEARGHPITFRGYLRYGVPATILTMIVGTLDIWLRYFVFR